MMTIRVVQRLVIASLAFAVLSAVAAPAQAQDRVRLAGRFTGIKARCSYEQRTSLQRYKFNLQLELATPGQIGAATATTAQGVFDLGSFTVDATGRGVIDIDSNEGDLVPALAAGNVITLHYGGRTYTANLQPR